MNIEVRAGSASARFEAQQALDGAFTGTLSGSYGGRHGIGYWLNMVLPDGVSLADAKETVAGITGVTIEERS